MSATKVDASEIIALMEDILEFLDRYTDVCDGPDGQLIPNTAMDLEMRIWLLIAALSPTQEAQEAQKESTRF